VRHDHDQRCHVIAFHRGSDYYHRCGLDDDDRGRNDDDSVFARYQHGES